MTWINNNKTARIDVAAFDIHLWGCMVRSKTATLEVFIVLILIINALMKLAVSSPSAHTELV